MKIELVHFVHPYVGTQTSLANNYANPYCACYGAHQPINRKTIDLCALFPHLVCCRRRALRLLREALPHALQASRRKAYKLACALYDTCHEKYRNVTYSCTKQLTTLRYGQAHAVGAKSQRLAVIRVPLPRRAHRKKAQRLKHPYVLFRVKEAPAT